MYIQIITNNLTYCIKNHIKHHGSEISGEANPKDRSSRGPLCIFVGPQEDRKNNLAATAVPKSLLDRSTGL
jgi:hypothetical protein